MNYELWYQYITPSWKRLVLNVANGRNYNFAIVPLYMLLVVINTYIYNEYSDILKSK